MTRGDMAPRPVHVVRRCSILSYFMWDKPSEGCEVHASTLVHAGGAMIIVKSARETCPCLILIIDYSSVHVDGNYWWLNVVFDMTATIMHQPRFSLPPFQYHDDMVLSGCRNWNDGGSKSEARPSYRVL
ncbi:unnamed protein product [Fusarium graminearum]|uniref:Chromosome 4, complete genome n=1 Tax=Gibberella zeae (strain ATCC MYA-4620 / CBS 123657 / FGSC 9075 / NRRL 31084 / PH-1) TaxID=229533 RepID=I1RSV7_GIBZE|nr:hypothetical protein FGSG_07242 [Fusarium graminearum PH-1]ESU13472.1 hypothetical protein FGSG_07242 [Fusarium graminearum PH-1]CEF85026.1 unnamed protein product [Fusarium graminearum]CZS73078.1 unnamed protein product [Fusarium graminearum]|eukprot:XP_011326979.1 hypothetical protein FGSG_07242 [Fusarium graminearum PH-1]